MPVKIFTIPFDHGTETFHDDEVNDFMLKNSIQTVKAECFQANGKVYWSMLIHYEAPLLVHEQEEAETLTKDQGQFLKQLFAFRKERAEKDGIPVFIVATNKQLKDVVLMRPRSLEQLRQINGFGKKKLQLYGSTILEMVATFYKDNLKNEDHEDHKVEKPSEQ